MDEWTDFKKKILETQKELLKLQQRRLLLKIAAKVMHFRWMWSLCFNFCACFFQAIQTAEVSEPDNCEPQERLQEEPTTSRASSRIAAKRNASMEDGESSGPSKLPTSGKNKKSANINKKKKK